jgi:hypothetical protein
MKIRAMLLIGLIGMLAGCEAPVSPEKIKLVYQPMLGEDLGDVVAVERPGHVGMPPGDLWGEPGEEVTVRFSVSNRVRSDVFVQADAAAAYASSVTTYGVRDAMGQIEPVGEARSVDPAAPAATYRLLLRLPQSAREERERGARSESSYDVQLPVKLPAGNWERAEITVVFYLHGFLRETKGEFRDTMTQTVRVNRKPSTRPAATGAAVSRPATRGAGDSGVPSIMFVRPLTRPADGVGTRPATGPGR